MIKEIVEAVSIPVMAKVRIGHFVEAQVTVPFITSETKCRS
jgi:pyridoxal biosynthesis lyase PdxS